MRRLKRLYMAASAILCGLLLTLAASLGAMLWLAPEWLQELGASSSALLARMSGAAPPLAVAAPGGGRGPEADSPGPRGKTAAIGATGSEAPPGLESYRGVHQPAEEKETWLDIGALESRLRQLESAAAARSPALLESRLDPGTSELKLAAWERIREPLLTFLSAPSRGRAGPTAIDKDGDIRQLEPELRARLKLLLEEEASLRKRILKGLEARTLARVLMEDRSISDGQAMELLSRLTDAGAHEVLERLSRLAPERAARMLQGMLTGEALGRDGGATLPQPAETQKG